MGCFLHQRQDDIFLLPTLPLTLRSPHAKLARLSTASTRSLHVPPTDARITRVLPASLREPPPSHPKEMGRYGHYAGLASDVDLSDALRDTKCLDRSSAKREGERTGRRRQWGPGVRQGVPNYHRRPPARKVG